MNFSLTSPQLLDLASYQRTLKNLIATFAAGSNPNNSRIGSHADTPDLTEVCLSSGAAVVMDTSVLRLPPLTTPSIGSSKPDPHPQQLSSSQNYPLAFVASSQVSSLLSSTPTSWPVLYYLRLPLNPLTHTIQCHVSARRLCPRHVSFLDKILRRLCDASPGAFMIGYSDGMSGVDPGIEVVYSESHLANVHTGSSEHTSSLFTGHKDLQESNHHPQLTGLAGHIEQSLSPAIIEGNHHHHLHQHHHYHQNSSSSSHSRIEDPHLPSARSLKTLKDNIAAASMSSTTTTTTTATTSNMGMMKEGPTIFQDRDRPDPALARVGPGVNEPTDVGIYDFGLADESEVFLDVSLGLGMDDVHDTLWVH
ncbi:hypothetical protein BGZ70_003396 [Mortierella alpina]|uniref:Uncharacterized protein n=1 Tax=Mortierella alpina TaxID=64518 RepID=A0A9P6ISV0_MORAP|nr:hypothetical protein BGZ70_003396 [Mortierella alpina]